MDLHFFGIADHAIVDRTGKLSIIGIFNRLNFKTFPNAHPIFHLIVIVQPSFGEVSDRRNFMIRLLDEDGHEKWHAKGEVRFGRGPDGRYALANIIIPFRNMRFDQPGTYEFVLLVDNNRFASTQLNVIDASPDEEEEQDPPELIE